MQVRVLTPDGRELVFAAQAGGHGPEPAGGQGAEPAAGSEGEGGHAAEETNPIIPATDELIWGTLSFLVLAVLMWKKAVPAVQKAMAARTERIRGDLDAAEQTKAQAEQVLADYQRQLADAKAESSRIIEEARQTAEQLRKDLRSQAEAEVTELRQRSVEDIKHAQERALADLRAQVSALAIEAAEIVVKKNLDRETNLALVQQFIDQVESARQ